MTAQPVPDTGTANSVVSFLPATRPAPAARRIGSDRSDTITGQPLGGILSRAEFIEVSATPNEVASTLRGFPETVREWSNAPETFEFRVASGDEHVGDVDVHVEEVSSGPYSTAIDVFSATWSDNPEKIQFIFDLVAKRTRWEIASRFDENDRPLVHRPRLD
ncbi:hypothetical protein [Nocardiopsis sp. NPDC057823]|uniref:hypothetical protein n=1 Tax=Nocardiopsis sp. NPDC057823 TaxID=3346256 RepID=UPI0036728342